MMKELIMNVDYFDMCFSACERGEGLYSADRIKSLLEKCRANGFDAVIWRTSVCGKVAYRSRVMTVFDAEYRLSASSLARILEEIDPLEVAVREAHKLGFKIYAWITLFDSYFPGLEDGFFAKNPRLLMISRDGKSVLRGVPCYACPETADYRQREAREISGYSVDGIMFSMHSHTVCTMAEGDLQGDDIFGFNPGVVEDFKKRYGHDIINEDYDKEAFYRLHGEYLTRFLKQVKDSLQAGQRLYVTSGHFWDGEFYHPFGYSKGTEPYPCWYQVKVYADQKRWASEGIVDGIVAQTDDPGRIAEIRRVCGSGPKYFIWCYCGFDKKQEEERMEVVKMLLEKMESSGADGITFHEAMTFEYGSGRLWQLVSKFK